MRNNASPYFLNLTDFTFWDNGVLCVNKTETLVALAHGQIYELQDIPVWPRYPLTIRKKWCGFCEVFGSDEIGTYLQQKIQPTYQEILVSSTTVWARTKEVVDPLIRNGTLVMTKPHTYEADDDLYWANDPWYLKNIAPTERCYMPAD